MFKKSSILLSVSLMLMVGGFLAWFFFGRDDQGTLSADVVATSTQTEQITISDHLSSLVASEREDSDAETIVLGTPSGSVEVRNFYRTGARDEGGSIVIARSDTYFISYDTFSSSFWIAIFGSDFDTIRKLAESVFLANLQISQADACRLDVSVTPYEATAERSDKSLSFCPGK